MQDKHPYLICDTICGMGITFPQVSKNEPRLHLVQRMRKNAIFQSGVNHLW